MENRKNFITNYFIGIFISFTITIILFYILGIILSTTSIPEKIITPAILTITGISILISTSIITLKINKKGFLIGGIIGITYYALLYLLSSILLKDFSINLYSIILLVLTFFCGAVGGIIGMNIKSSKK